MKYMMVISYDGSKFYGFQRQNNKRNVQGYLEDILSSILDEKILIKGAGRTDRGVHALGQVVHFETDKKVKYLKKKLNEKLIDCYVKKIKKVDNDFHARYRVKNKTYLYKIDLSNTKNPLYYLNMSKKLDINKMKKVSKLFLGNHDFHNFVAGERNDYHGTIQKVKIYKLGTTLFIKFQGIGFYRYMVRNLVGALVQVGKGKVYERYIYDMLNNPNIEKRLTTVSPNGLYLVKIRY